MEIDVVGLLRDTPQLVLFLVLGFGYLLGNIRLGPIEFGPVTGVLLAALVFGHFELVTGDTSVLAIGFTFFIYCVGLQAGPSFFSVVRQGGAQYALLVLVCAGSAVATVVLLSAQIGLTPALSAGVLGGSLTSTPTLAAAQDAVKSGLVEIPAGETVRSFVDDIAVGYALTYLVGMIGLLTLVRLIPMVFRLDLAEEARKVSKYMRLPGSPEELEEAAKQSWRPLGVVYRVAEGEVTRAPLGQLDLPNRTGCVIEKIKRGDEMIVPTPDVTLVPGDLVKVMGPVEAQPKIEAFFDGMHLEPELLGTATDFKEVFVSSSEVAGKALRDLNIIQHYGCYIVGVSRAQVQMRPGPDFVVERGDVLYAYGSEEGLAELASTVGHIEKDVNETDLLTFAFGIAAGILLGQINLKVGEVSLGLGMAGGLLVSGILVGFLRTFNPTFGRVPRPAQWIFMELGLMLFMAGIGLQAGSGIVEAISEHGPRVLLAGLIVLVVPVVAGWFFGTLVLRMNPALLIGAITGALTSTPALGVANRAARSAVPSLGYAGAYPMANILLALAGTILVRT